MTNIVYIGDVRETYKKLTNNSIDCLSCSPPYFGLRNYAGNDKQIGREASGSDYHPQDTISIIKRLSVPWCMTYGDTCHEDFPEFDWKLAFKTKLPILRGGGTKERGEWITYG